MNLGHTILQMYSIYTSFLSGRKTLKLCEHSWGSMVTDQIKIKRTSSSPIIHCFLYLINMHSIMRIVSLFSRYIYSMRKTDDWISKCDLILLFHLWGRFLCSYFEKGYYEKLDWITHQNLQISVILKVCVLTGHWCP